MQTTNQHQIETPSLIVGLPPSDYHATPAISAHGLNNIRKCPAYFRHCRDNPPDPTPAMRIGTLTHLAVIEPDRFATEVMVAPNVDRRTSAGKAEWAQFVIEAGDR